MLGFRLFLHALRMILSNLPAAIRISLPALPCAAVFALMEQRAIQIGGLVSDRAGRWRLDPDAMGGGFVSAYVAAFLVFYIVMMWVAVGWHRYILCEEGPSAFGPPWAGKAIWRYFVASLVFAIYMILWAIVFVILAAILAYILSGILPPNLLRPFITAFIGVPLTIIGYRASPVLPSAALGERMRVRDSIRATAGANGSFVVVGVISVLASMALAMPAPILAQMSMSLGLVWQIATTWITTLAGVSILTTIYGHFIEKRDLNV